MPGRIKQVEDDSVFGKCHNRASHGNPALLLDLHPVRTRAPVLAARPHLTGGADRPARQQQVLGQGRLARIGVRDDGEGTSFIDGVLHGQGKISGN
mgnify:CR=1 FL=1